MNPSVNKKILLSMVITAALMIGGTQFTYAQGHGQGHGSDNSHHQDMDNQHHGLMHNEAEQKTKTDSLEKFLNATTPLRKSYTQKRAEMKALMHSTNPDIATASKISGELFDIREQLVKAAKENDLKVPVALRLAGGGIMDGGMNPKGCQGQQNGMQSCKKTGHQDGSSCNHHNK
ncbi:MAG: hypothetical protein OEM02_11090 [Desulfobulbaceae bacterium]|nr:hypothetical protein [Desulfobulbaceae bacterium]